MQTHGTHVLMRISSDWIVNNISFLFITKRRNLLQDSMGHNNKVYEMGCTQFQLNNDLKMRYNDFKMHYNRNSAYNIGQKFAFGATSA